MTSPFVNPDKILTHRRRYSLLTNNQSGDGFFIDKKYQGRVGVSVSGKKINWLFTIIVLCIIFLLGRLFYLQILKHKDYLAIAEGNRIKVEVVPSPRGIFYDRWGMALVENTPRFSLLVKKETLQNNPIQPDKLVKEIADLTGLTPTEIEDQLTKSLSDVKATVADFDISYASAMLLKANSDKYADLDLQLVAQRKYYFGGNLSQVLGYLGKLDEQEWNELKYQGYQFFDVVGKAGLEKSYEKILRGQPGKIENEVDAQGKVIKVLAYKDALPGKNLTLTIDKELTDKLIELLTAQLKSIGKSKAAAVALNPQTGEILSLVSLPTVNNNLFADPQKNMAALSQIFSDQRQPLFNRVVSGEYPSGSTIKLLVAAAGLEEGVITEWTQILSTGGIQIDKWFFPDWKAGGHGLTNVTKALAESVNTFFYYVVGGYQDFKGLGLEKLVKYAKKFGLNQKLGVDLPGEATGFLPSREWKETTKNEPWYIGDTYHLAIGQGDLLVTPLQIASLTATIANGGKVLQPFLVKEIVDTAHNTKTITKSKIISTNFISSANLALVQKGLRRAVTEGSAVSLNDLPFTSAAKTGTAQVGGEATPHAWFTVYAPYDNPEIVLTVLIENGGEGSATALPVAKEALRWWMTNK